MTLKKAICEHVIYPPLRKNRPRVRVLRAGSPNGKLSHSVFELVIASVMHVGSNSTFLVSPQPMDGVTIRGCV